MHEGLGRPQIEELRQLRSRVAQFERDNARRRDLEEAHRILVNHAPQGLLLLQEERVVFANQAAADLLGYGTDELTRTTLEQALGLVHPEDRPLVRQRHTDRLQGLPAPTQYEFRVTHKDGSLRRLEIRAGVVAYRGRPAIQIALLDVTADKHRPTEPTLYESKLKSIFRAAYVGIGLLMNRVLLEVNDRFCEMLGYRREELIGQSARMLYATQEEYDYVGREKYGQIEQRGAGAVETRWRRKDGGIIDVLVGSIPLDPKDLSKGVTFTALDITERKRAEDALRENRAKLQTILDSSPCAIAVSDLQGRVVEANTASLNMFGIASREKGIGRSILEFASPGERDKAQDNLARTLAEGRPKNVEYVLVRDDGSEFIGEVSSSIIRDADGNPAGIVMVANDITERKQSERLTRILHDLAVNLGAIGNLDKGLRLCLRAAIDASGLDCGGVYLRDELSGGLDMPCHMGLSDDFVAQVSHYDIEAANTRVVMSGRPVYAVFEKLGGPRDEIALREGLRAIAVIPLLHRDQVIGCLNVASHSLMEVPSHSRSILETIASQIGDTITRLRAEEEVRREREMLDRIADTSPAGITVVDREGRLKFANPRAEEILGLAREQITQRTYNAPEWHITDFDGGPFPEKQLPFRQVMTTGQPVHNVGHAIEWPDGRRVLLSINAAPILDPAGQMEGVVATIDDVTEEVQAKNALRESEEMFSAIVGQANDGIILIQGKRLIFANQALADLSGYRREELCGRPFLDFVAPESRELVARRVESRLRGENVPSTYETKILRRDGQTVDVELVAAVIQHRGMPTDVGIIRDITERRRSEALTEFQRDLAVNLGAINDLEEGLRLCLQGALAASGLDCGGVYLRDEASGAMDLRCHTGLPDGFIGRVCHYDRDAVPVQLTMTGEPIYANYAKLNLPPDEAQSREALQAVAIIPLVLRERVIGCLNVASHNITEVPQSSRIALETIAGQISGAITRLKAERALRESEERIQNLIRHSSSMFYAHTPDHVLTYVSPQSCDILGCAPEEAHTRWQEYLSDHPGNLQGIEATERALQTGQRQPPYELELVTHQGRKIWVRVDESPVVQDGKTVAIVGSITDITERKWASEALRVSEERFRTLFEAAPDAIYLTDLEGKLVDANKTAERLAGVSKNQALGRSLLELGLLSEQEAPKAAAHLKANARGEATGPEEFTLRRPDGVSLTMETRTFPITIDNRVLVLGIARDITERKHAEKQAREHHEQLLHISRVSTLGEMASGLAHELNQPLSAILSHAVASQRSVEPRTANEELLRRNLDQVIAQTKRAGEIVKRVRAFVQQRPAFLRPTALNDIIREALALLRFDMIHKEIPVVLDLSADLPHVQADTIQLEQALLNLVRNAIEAMETTAPPERRLTIRTTAPDADTVRVTVSDTGMGLPPEIQDRVFNPFVTTKPNGLGVGLSITRTIIELHRGQLWVEPADGRGCTFVFTLPAALEDLTTST